MNDIECVVAFIIPGRPVPAARMTRRGKYVKPNAQRYLAYKEAVGWEARAVMKNTPPLGGAIAVEIWAYLSKGRRMGDVDNIGKAVLDGMNKIVYEDDEQVVDLTIHRREGLPQRTEVKVWPVAI